MLSQKIHQQVNLFPKKWANSFSQESGSDSGINIVRCSSSCVHILQKSLKKVVEWRYPVLTVSMHAQRKLLKIANILHDGPMLAKIGNIHFLSVCIIHYLNQARSAVTEKMKLEVKASECNEQEIAFGLSFLISSHQLLTAIIQIIYHQFTISIFSLQIRSLVVKIQKLLIQSPELLMRKVLIRLVTKLGYKLILKSKILYSTLAK